MLRHLKFVTGHPLNRRRPFAALMRVAAWQVRSRIETECLYSWIDGTRLAVRKGMTGATGNIYCGLHEFADMAFVLHALRAEDVFLDIGANVGTYTVLASGVCGARTIAFEPDPDTAEHFRRNIEINDLGGIVELHQLVLGDAAVETAFTKGLDTVNHVALPGDAQTRIIPMRRLDNIDGTCKAKLIKLDVEGFEARVLAGARKVLASPSLMAVETEAVDSATSSALREAGFTRRWYDPWRRRLLHAPHADTKASNALFVRGEAAILDRVQAAPRRRVQDQYV